MVGIGLAGLQVVGDVLAKRDREAEDDGGEDDLQGDQVSCSVEDDYSGHLCT